MSHMTYNILRNAYANEEHRGRRGRMSSRLREIQGHMNAQRSDANAERWRRRNDACDDIEETFSIPDVQGTMIFVMTETMCSSLEQGLMCREIRDLGRNTYIALDNPLLARAFDV